MGYQAQIAKHHFSLEELAPQNFQVLFMASHALPPSSTHQPTHLQVWRSLEALELVRLSKSNIAHWRLALQLLPDALRW